MLKGIGSSANLSSILSIWVGHVRSSRECCTFTKILMMMVQSWLRILRINLIKERRVVSRQSECTTVPSIIIPYVEWKISSRRFAITKESMHN